MFLSFLLASGVIFAQSGDKTKLAKKAVLSLSFNELPNTIQVLDGNITYSKFSNTLKVSCKGVTQYEGVNTSYTINLTLPKFDFNNGAGNNYTNEDSHFFDAHNDAAFTLDLGGTRFGNLYRSKEKENILSKVATTDYQISATNVKDKRGSYLILIRINSGSILQESSETKSKTEEKKLHIAKDPISQIQITNPQPMLPKVEAYKFKSSSEVYHPTGPLK